MLTFDAPWDLPGSDPIPVLRRYSTASPATMAELPVVMSAHPFAPIIEAHPDPVLAHHARSPVALDPGTDLSDWTSIDWQAIDGPVGVTTTGLADEYTVPLQRLSDFASNWATPRFTDIPSMIDVDPRLTRRVGRGGALVDALLTDPDAVVSEHLVVYDEGDPAGFVAEAAGRLGKRAFSRQGVAPTVAERAARGRSISSRNVDRALQAVGNDGSVAVCALPGCDKEVVRRNASFCSKSHRDRAYRRRKQVGSPASDQVLESECPGCGAVLYGKAMTGPCPICSNQDGTE